MKYSYQLQDFVFFFALPTSLEATSKCQELQAEHMETVRRVLKNRCWENGVSSEFNEETCGIHGILS